MKKILLGFLTTLMITASATAFGFPNKPVKIVVPSGPGGGTDLVTRVIAKELNNIWQSGVVVENRPGANTMLGTNYVLTSPADGHTLTINSSSQFASVRALTEKDPFDWEQHLSALSTMSPQAFVLVTSSKKNVKNLRELADLGRSKGLTYGDVSGGSPMHIYGAVTADKINTQGIRVMYKAIPQIVVDILNGQLDYAVLNLASVSQHIQNQTMTPLAVFDDRPLPGYPGLPTLVSQQFSEYRTMMYAWNFFVRKDTPTAIKNQLQKDVNQAIRQAMPELVEKGLVGSYSEFDLNAARANSEIWFRTTQKLGK
jgi:tripartite-type tricarboxylate transporter receptor subunit TctC